jgi:NADH-quinone oxidoreductase subunit G
MTIAPDRPARLSQPTTPELVMVTIDGIEVRVPKGTLIIRAAETIGVTIPRFCDHPLLDPVGACRQCIVEVEGQRKPVASCTTTVADGMVVKTQLSSEVAAKAQRGTMEMLLINHPLDCPICDKGGECPLQNQAMANGRAESRFVDVKRTYPKPIPISSQVLLDRERCVLCARCTRFSQQIAGDPFIELYERGALEQVSIDAAEPFQSYFSGNTVQICPVGALTGAAYRFRARPFDLVSTPSVCEHCASGCAQRTDWRRGKVQRRLAADDPAVNEEWNCDKGRWAFTYATQADRLLTPLVRDSHGELVPTSWTEAVERAAEGLAEARSRGGAAVLTGGRLTMEDAYAHAKFARLALGTNDVDFRARPHSAEEAGFLAVHVAGLHPENGGLSYAELEAAPIVLLAGLDPEEESPIVGLRLRKAWRKRGLRVVSIAPFVSPGTRKAGGVVLRTVPGGEASALRGLLGGGSQAVVGADGVTGELDLAAALREPGAAILVGERLATVPGALTAVADLSVATGAALAWVPRRAGDRGAVEAGALPALLPGGRRVSDPAARSELEALWGVGPGTLPAEPGRDTTGIIAAALAGEINTLVVAGLDPDDLPDPAAARAALARVGFVVSLEVRPSAVTEHADVVLPVAPAAEKAGTYLNWEGRGRPFEATLDGTGALPDARVLDAIAVEMDADLFVTGGQIGAVRAELTRVLAAPPRSSVPAPLPRVPDIGPGVPGPGEALLATWHHLLDGGRMQDGEPNLAGTARPARVRMSAATAAEIGLDPATADGAPVTVSTSRGSITLPALLVEMPDRVVWLPTNSTGSAVRLTLAADAGALVTVSAGGEV